MLEIEKHSTDELLELLKESQKTMKKFSSYYIKLDSKSKEFLTCHNAAISSMKLYFIIQDIISSRIGNEFEKIFKVKPHTLQEDIFGK